MATSSGYLALYKAHIRNS